MHLFSIVSKKLKHEEASKEEERKEGRAAAASHFKLARLMHLRDYVKDFSSLQMIVYYLKNNVGHQNQYKIPCNSFDQSNPASPQNRKRIYFILPKTHVEHKSNCSTVMKFDVAFNEPDSNRCA